jgi:hypothetical protein
MRSISIATRSYHGRGNSAAKLMLEAAEGGSLENVVQQFERILFQQNKLILQA